MRRQLFVCAVIVSILSCYDNGGGGGFKSSGIFGPGEGPSFNIVYWDVTLDSLIESEQTYANLEIDSNNYNHYFVKIPLLDSLDIHVLSIYGKAQTVFNDSTYLATSASIYCHEISLINSDPTAYIKNTRTLFAGDTLDGVVNTTDHTKYLSDYVNGDTSYTILRDNSSLDMYYSPIDYEMITSDSLGYFSFQLRVPNAIEADTLRLEISPRNHEINQYSGILNMSVYPQLIFQSAKD